MTKKALIFGAGLVLVLAVIFVAGCTGNQSSEGTVVQTPALGGYDVAFTIGDAPDNNKLITEKAVYDALDELKKQINENANSGGIMVMGSGKGSSTTINNAVWGKVTGHLADQTDLQDALNAKVNTSDIVDDLTSDDAAKVLSAKQGNILNTTLGTKVDKVAGSSLVEDAKISGYDTHVADTTIHVTAANKTAWDGKQDADKLVTSFQTTPDDTHYPSEKLVNDTLTLMKQEIFDSIYPIGSYAFGVKPTMGTWTEVEGDRAIWLKSGTSDGSTIDQSLPNIKGSISFQVSSSAAAGNHPYDKSGALSYSTSYSYYGETVGSKWNSMTGLFFNATTSNPVYSDTNSKVQPDAYVMTVWKRTA